MGKSATNIDRAAAAEMLNTLRFAEEMVVTVRKRRAAQLTAGTISQEKHDADVAAAESLLRLAQDKLIFDPLPLN